MAHYHLNQRVLYRPLITALRTRDANSHYQCLLRTKTTTTTTFTPLKSTPITVFKTHFSTTATNDSSNNSNNNNNNTSDKDGSFVSKFKESISEYRRATTQLYQNWKRVNYFLAPRHASGLSLSREDFQLMKRTKKDIRSFVPFFIYALFPFSFVLLPLVVRFIPELIPSIYLNSKDKHIILQNTQKRTVHSWIELRSHIVTYLKYIHEHPSSTRLTTDQLNSLEFFDSKLKHLLETNQPLSQQDIEKIEPLFYGPLSLKRLAEGGPVERDILACLGKGHLVGLGFLPSLNYFYASWKPSYIINSIEEKLDIILEDDILIYHHHSDLKGTELEEACEERCIPFLKVPESDLLKILHKWVLFTVKSKKYPRDMLAFLPALDFLSVPEETALVEFEFSQKSKQQQQQ